MGIDCPVPYMKKVGINGYSPKPVMVRAIDYLSPYDFA